MAGEYPRAESRGRQVRPLLTRRPLYTSTRISRRKDGSRQDDQQYYCRPGVHPRQVARYDRTRYY